MSQELIDYFMSETNAKIDVIADDIKEVKKDLHKLLAFRLAVLGISTFAATTVAMIVSLIVALLKH